MAKTCDPSFQEAELASWDWVWDQPVLHSKFQACQGFIQQIIKQIEEKEKEGLETKFS